MKTTLTTTILLLFTQFCLAQDFWIEINRPVDARVYSLVIDAEKNIIAGMGTDNGVHLSNNIGESWLPIGLENLSIYSLHIHQNGNIFAGTGGSNKIYRLNNYEEGWVPIISGVPNIISLASSTQGDIFAGSGGEYGLLRSINNGDDWEQLVTLTSTEQTNAIVTIGDSQIYIGTIDFMGGGGVYRSYDNGDTWEHAGLLNKFISSLAVNSQDVLFAGSIGNGNGVYRSFDNGDTWAYLKYDVFVTSIVITPDDVIYIGCSNEHGTQGGVFRSIDDGETWELLNSGIEGYLNECIYGLSLAPDGYLYAYGYYLYRSVNPVFTPNTILLQETIDLKIFPNPFTNFLNIEIPNDKLLLGYIPIKVFDSAGRLVYSQSLNNQYGNAINLSFLRPGLYYIRLGEGRHRYAKSILKY